MSVITHFLDVGQGDCTIIHFPERTTSNGRKKAERVMMTDIYHHDDDPDYEHVIDYYKEHFSNADGTLKSIFRFVCTHPHQDHICGLNELFDASGISIANFWDLTHDWEPEDYDHHPTHKDDWDTYEETRQSTSSPRVIRTKREDSPGDFWNDDEDRISILSPSDALIKHAHYKEDGTKRGKNEIEIDEMSYALSIRVNSRKIVLAGDGRETPFWADIHENCQSDLRGCAILKAGHHGQLAGFHEDAVKLMAPEYIVFSNSEDQDKANGAGEEYLEAVPSAEILKTCDVGTIVMECPYDGEKPINVATSR